ncbi:hypothetical protein HMPREF1544_05223 [Mucor circinelloides 1006PhL]|uniref:EF-hand domain-containing protein n=1 Tax=Mucor circinelloides f. circinelloides (strain 1006PhL) TaxID=1220926 RepID=S2JHF1_MUCC1|nr:hypothetical protein HMPREF1544_05223 [Mucor circinelloides 1006PhL]
MLRLPRLVNAHALKGCARQNAVKGVHMRNYSMLNAKSAVMAAPAKRVFEPTPLGASKIIALATMTTASAPLFYKPSAQCQAAAKFNSIHDTFEAASYENKKINAHHNKPIFNKGELTFGTFLGICTGFLVKKVGKIFAAFVGTGFVFLQYLSQQGYVTIHWDRLEGGYTNALDLDKDGKVSKRDLTSRWQKFVNFLTNNLQFKSTFLIGFYAGIRYG